MLWPMGNKLLTRPVGGGPLEPAEASECEARRAAGELVWLDVVTSDPGELDELGLHFGFDPAAIEDVLDIEQLPKYEDHGEYLFVVLHALASDGERLDTVEVDCFVSAGLLVTVAAVPVDGIAWLWEAAARHAHLAAGGAGELFAQLTEVLGRGYLHVLDEFELRIDGLADRALAADPDILADVQVLRREEATIRKVLRPQRLVLAGLRRDVGHHLGDRAGAQLVDAFDVHNQVVESLATARGLLTDTLDTYRGAAADRQAAATTVLAVYSAVMLPLTFLTGWYGMNLGYLPGAGDRGAWVWVAALMVLIAGGSFAAFARAGFVHGPRLRAPAHRLRGLAAVARRPVDAAMMTRVRRNGR